MRLATARWSRHCATLHERAAARLPVGLGVVEVDDEGARLPVRRVELVGEVLEVRRERLGHRVILLNARPEPAAAAATYHPGMDLARLFARHVDRLQEEAEKSLAETGYDSLVLSSGAPHTYFADDQDAPFHATPHFAHWCPLGGPHHLLHVVPGRKPRLVRCAPEDYWYEQGGVTDPFWVDAFEFEEAGSADAAWAAIGQPARAAYVGNETDRAASASLAAQPGAARGAARLDAQLQGRVRGPLPRGGDGRAAPAATPPRARRSRGAPPRSRSTTRS